MRRLFAFALMPIMLAPLLLAAPRLIDELTPNGDRDPLAAPVVHAIAPAAVPVHPRAVPVLVYHGVALHGAAPDRWTVTRTQLAQQLLALQRTGYETLDAVAYARFMRGAPGRLPPRPILITFDDGRLDSYRGADAILEQTGMHAVMFAIADRVSDRFPGFLNADELRRMSASGRWDVALHAGSGHRLVRSARGGRGPFYATRTPGETRSDWRARVAQDLDAGARRLRVLVPRAQLDLFAVPYSDYGQGPGGEPRIASALRTLLTGRFTAAFVQRDRPSFSTPQADGMVGRLEIGREVSAAELLAWLRDQATAHGEARATRPGSWSSGRSTSVRPHSTPARPRTDPG